MELVLEKIENLLNSIGQDELLKNPAASAKATEIVDLIEDMKKNSKEKFKRNGLLSYLAPKTLLEH